MGSCTRQSEGIRCTGNPLTAGAGYLMHKPTKTDKDSKPLLILAILSLFVLVDTSVTAQDQASAEKYFAIQVVDKESGRGVPLVTLTTVNNVQLTTDSAGWVAFYEPGLMNRQVFFHVSSHGYEYPKDGFGYRGVRLETIPGGSGKIELPRVNIAERLYRITGQGIYGNSVLLDRPVPIKKANLSGGVLGQDTVQVANYHDRLYWFWGDTNRASYPLGQFKTSGATSLLPTTGGLNPSDGIDLDYFVDRKNFSRQMAPVEGPGAVWLHGLFVLPTSGEPPKMIAHYARVKSLAKRYEHGLVLFNVQSETFDKLIEFDSDAMLYPRGQAIYQEGDTGGYIYFATAMPFVRVKATLDDILDSTQYEAYTPLARGERYAAGESKIDRDEKGNVVWGWKPDTDLIDARRQQALHRFGLLKESEFRSGLRDDSTGELVHTHAGSVHWNHYRNRWIMIASQVGAKQSYLGEVWYAESDHLEGPWMNARKVVTHDKYTFYNPAHHPFFDQQGGRLIYFQGTYATTFSAAKSPTPRYNYNQIMYRLDLSHPRMSLKPNEQDR